MIILTPNAIGMMMILIIYTNNRVAYYVLGETLAALNDRWVDSRFILWSSEMPTLSTLLASRPYESLSSSRDSELIAVYPKRYRTLGYQMTPDKSASHNLRTYTHK